MVTQRKVKERASRVLQRGNARRLRSEQTNAERKFWWHVRGRGLAGYKFGRQYPIGPYIADFVCLEANFVVELDGSQHAKQAEYDLVRDAFLMREGFRVLRIRSGDLLRHTEGVMESVGRALRGEAPSP